MHFTKLSIPKSLRVYPRAEGTRVDAVSLYMIATGGFSICPKFCHLNLYFQHSISNIFSSRGVAIATQY